MRTSDVQRIALTLTAFFAAAAALFAVVVGPREPRAKPAPSGDGRASFEARCADCHTLDELVERLRSEPDRGLAAVELLAFLEHHTGAGADEDRAVVRMLLESAR